MLSLFEAEISVERHASKKNSKQIFKSRAGRTFIASSNLARISEAWLIAELSRHKMEHPGLPIKVPMNAKILFIFSRQEYFTKKMVRSKTLGDLSNLYEVVQDALEKAGIIENDRLIYSHDGSQIMFGPTTKLVIELSEFCRTFLYSGDDVL